MTLPGQTGGAGLGWQALDPALAWLSPLAWGISQNELPQSRSSETLDP